MKKYLIIGLSLFSSLFLVNKVSAETKEFDYGIFNKTNFGSIYLYEEYYDSYKYYDNFNQSLIDTQIGKLVSEWEKNYKSEFPNYFISISSYPKAALPLYTNVTYPLVISLIYSKYIPVSVDLFKDTFNNKSDDVGLIYIESTSNFEFQDISSVSSTYLPSLNIFDTYDGYSVYLSTLYYDSNFDLPFGLDDTYVVKKDEEVLFTLSNKNDLIPTYKSKFVDKTDLNYVEVNLNSYPYIALSLKDYSKTEEFSTINYSKGQYCLTPVYNYGLSEKKDIIDGSKNQRCSLYYDDYTPVKTYILKSDIENHAIYYLKAYDTTKENKVKIDTSIFNIHYITEEEKDNPIIVIDGKKYTPKSYDELTDTATKSEDENYVSGGSCAVGDFNCTRNYLNNNFSWSDIFNSPLKFLKSMWSSIIQVFIIINMFISLLPLPLQYFLYLSFMLAIILGLIKIIL